MPTVERSSIKQDLLRRDFTINTLALRLDGRHYGELHDYFSGLKDLHKGMVRVLHSLSFVDDPTRLLRAVRFEQRFGFKIEPRTLDLAREALPQLKHLGGERLHHEFDLIFDESQAAAMMARLKEMGILATIDSSLPWDESTARLLPVKDMAGAAEDWGLAARTGGVPMPRALAYLVWLARLPLESIERVCLRLKLAGSLCQALISANRLLQVLPGLEGQSPSQVVERLKNTPLPAIYAAYLLIKEEPLRLLLYLYATRWRHIQAISDGNTLRARGLIPSPVFGEILRTLRSAWLDGQVHNAQEEDALLETLIEQWKLLPG
jgi:tRNA nucleotidyltransferase (CCA-adding enzyme)